MLISPTIVIPHRSAYEMADSIHEEAVNKFSSGDYAGM